MSEDNFAEAMANDILIAAGSSLRHYTPPNRAAIIAKTREWIDSIHARAMAMVKEGDIA